MPQMYNALAGLGEEDVEMINAVLADAPCVWVGNGFVTPGRVAFRYTPRAGFISIPLKGICASAF